MNIRRINFIGSPGSRKSTTAAWLFSELKTRHYSVELVTEYVKRYAIEKKKIEKYDQIKFFNKQLEQEYHWLRYGVKNIISDSPLLLNIIYSRIVSGDKIANLLGELMMEFEKDYPSFNVLLYPTIKEEYKTEGRYQTCEESHGVYSLINGDIFRKKLFQKGNYMYCEAKEKGLILDTILRKISFK